MSTSNFLYPAPNLSVIMDVVMVICSILCLIGDRHSPLRLLGICMIHFATVFTAQMLDVLEITDMFGRTTFWWMIVECVFLLVFMGLLLRPGIREDTVKNRIRKGITVISSELVTGPSVSISAKDIGPLVGKDRSRWETKDGSDSISEYTAEVHEEKRITYLTSYRWKDEEEIRLTAVSGNVYRPYGSGFVLRDHSIENADGVRYLRLYGDDGMFIRLLIEEGEPEPVKEDEDIDEPVQYLKDKMMTG